LPIFQWAKAIKMGMMRSCRGREGSGLDPVGMHFA
jgi:hypothetical protein